MHAWGHRAAQTHEGDARRTRRRSRSRSRRSRSRMKRRKVYSAKR